LKEYFGLEKQFYEKQKKVSPDFVSKWKNLNLNSAHEIKKHPELTFAGVHLSVSDLLLFEFATSILFLNP